MKMFFLCSGFEILFFVFYLRNKVKLKKLKGTGRLYDIFRLQNWQTFYLFVMAGMPIALLIIYTDF